MRVTMIGSGYVGLVSGACFADFGHSVICVDKDPRKISNLEAGKMPIYEPGLQKLVSENVQAGRLSFSIDLKESVENSECVFIAVGTPSRRGDGHADLSYVYSAALDIAHALPDNAVVVTKSTVPVGTGDEVEDIIRRARPALNFSVASNPEFLREGAAIEDFKRPDRIIIGAQDMRSIDAIQSLYRPLYLNQAPFVVTSRRTAELTKYASNAFLATKITFINEIADLCEKVGANVLDVARGIGLDNRIGSKFLHPGPGYGGSCFPKDTLALIKTAQDYESPMRIIEAVVSVNEQRKRAMARKVIAACGGTVRGKQVSLLGLTFKPNTDDMRDAPSLSIIAGLQDAGAQIVAYDPEGINGSRELLTGVRYASDPYSCAMGAHALVIVTEWDIFRALDLGRIKSNMAEPVLVDLRNIYRPDDVKTEGFSYYSVGQTSK